jgi:hypothetical protein
MVQRTDQFLVERSMRILLQLDPLLRAQDPLGQERR